MAPFLRISFNSYELGSLQAADEASQPFCAVRMKEALSTGRAAGTGSSRGGRGSQGQGEAMEGTVPCSPRASEGSFSSLSSSPCPAQLAMQDN